VRFIANVFKGILALFMVVGVVFAGVFIFLWMSQTLDASTPDTPKEPVTFTIEPGQSVSQIADNLQSAGIIDNTLVFKARLKLKGAESSLKAGKFLLTPGTDVDELITTLSTTPKEIGIKFTIIEGMRIEEIAERLDSRGVVSITRFLELAGTPEGVATFQNDFLVTSGRPADQGLEGYLFPDTYEIKHQDGDNSEEIIQLMLNTMIGKFTPEMLQRIDEKQRNVHQVLTIASIVQREGQVKEELPRIAAVFWNRLDIGMSLDADPTTQYALGRPGDWWAPLKIAPRDVDHPYNTYGFAGLPPGPICNPGLEAILAAVTPAESTDLFFVAKCDGSGEHMFTESFDEHQRNIVECNGR